MKNTKVRNFHDVKNQFIIETPEAVYFQSYDTVIAKRMTGGQIFLDRDNWDYSATTGKYRNKFTGMDKKETQKAIDDGRILLDDLN